MRGNLNAILNNLSGTIRITPLNALNDFYLQFNKFSVKSPHDGFTLIRSDIQRDLTRTINDEIGKEYRKIVNYGNDMYNSASIIQSFQSSTALDDFYKSLANVVLIFKDTSNKLQEKLEDLTQSLDPDAFNRVA